MIKLVCTRKRTTDISSRHKRDTLGMGYQKGLVPNPSLKKFVPKIPKNVTQKGTNGASF